MRSSKRYLGVDPGVMIGLVLIAMPVVSPLVIMVSIMMMMVLLLPLRFVLLLPRQPTLGRSSLAT
jgi:hypothetical protein